MEKSKHSVHINAHYTAENRKTGVRVYREDTLIFPCFNEEETVAYMRHIRQLIDSKREITVYTVRLSESERLNRHGFKEFDKVNCRMFRKLADGVMETMTWSGETFDENRETLTVKNAVKLLWEEIYTQLNWKDWY